MDDLLIAYSIKPARLILPLFLMLSVSPALPLHQSLVESVRHIIVILLIGAVTWLIVSMLGVIEDSLVAGYRIDMDDNLQGIALTEPIRLDDVVIVEGEYGRVEEILSTYVVVRVWVKRRIVLPLTYFIEHPFQN